MAESFNKAVKRSVGIVTANSSGVISTTTTTISGISTAGVAIGDFVLNNNFRIGAKVLSVGTGAVTMSEASVNTAYAAGQQVDFSRPVDVLTASEKNIIIGGTLSNLTNAQISATVVVSTSDNIDVMLLADIPVPSGSSVVISDAGKTVLGAGDTVRVFSNTNNSLDVNFSFLTGVN